MRLRTDAGVDEGEDVCERLPELPCDRSEVATRASFSRSARESHGAMGGEDPHPSASHKHSPVLALANSSQKHGISMAKALQTHGKSMANAWQTHGKSMAKAWQKHGNSMAKA